MVAAWRKAIIEMCKGCIFDPYTPGTWRVQIEDCSSRNCPLYDLRPVSRATTNKRNDDLKRRGVCVLNPGFGEFFAKRNWRR